MSNFSENKSINSFFQRIQTKPSIIIDNVSKNNKNIKNLNLLNYGFSITIPSLYYISFYHFCKNEHLDIVIVKIQLLTIITIVISVITYKMFLDFLNIRFTHKEFDLNEILSLNNISGYYDDNEKGAQLNKTQINDFKKSGNMDLLLKSIKNNNIELFKKVINPVGYYFTKKKCKNTYRCLLDCHSSIKIATRLLFNESLVDLSFLDKYKIGNKFNHCSKIAYNHRLDKTKFYLQLDLSKAFENVNRQFVYKTLDYYNFNKFYIEAVRFLIEDLKLKYNNKYVIHNKGIHQGIPFSNNLFAIVINYITERIDKILNHKYNIIYGQDYLIQWYVDDAIIKFKNSKSKIIKIITNVIFQTMDFYQLPVNIKKTLATENCKLKYLDVITSKTKYLGLINSKDKYEVLDYINEEIKNKNKEDIYKKYNLDLEFVNDIYSLAEILENENELYEKFQKLTNKELKDKFKDFVSNCDDIKNIINIKNRLNGFLRYKLINLIGCVGIRNKKDLNTFLNKQKLHNLTKLDLNFQN